MKVEVAWDVSCSLFRAKVVVIPKEQQTRFWTHRVQRMERSEGSPILDSKTQKNLGVALHPTPISSN